MQAGDRKIGDAGEHIGEPRLWVDVVETAGRDNREHDGGTIGPTLGAGEGPVSTPECNSSQSPLGRIVRETNPAIVEETGVSGISCTGVRLNIRVYALAA